MRTAVAENINNKEGSVIHPKKMIIWIFMISVVMLFAGLTSYLIVRKAKGNCGDVVLPSVFVISTVVIILSSIIQHTGMLLYKKGKKQLGAILAVGTFLLGCYFMYTQKVAWMSFYEQGYPVGFEGSDSSVSIIYILVWAHLAHIIVALLYIVALLFVIVYPRFTDSVERRFENSTTFWHFLGLLWIYLYVFLLLNYN